MLDIKKQYLEKWFEYTIPSGETVKVKLRHYPDEMRVKDHNDCLIKKEDGEDDLDSDRYTKKLLDWAIQDWEGIGSNGKEIVCNLKNKLSFMTNFEPIVTDWITMSYVAANFQKPLRDILKNYVAPSSLNGNGTNQKAEIKAE